MIDTTSFKIVNTSWMMQGEACWVPISDAIPLRCIFPPIHRIKTEPVANTPLFVRAHIQKLNGNRTSAKLIYMEANKGPEEVAVKELVKANSDYDKFPEGWPDVSNMNIVNDPEIIGDIKLRYKQSQNYTYSAKSLISCGVKASDDIASLRNLNEYKLQLFDRQNSILKDITPHIFSMVFLAHLQIQTNKVSQQIFFSGVSGSGKSTNVRACLKLMSKLREETGGPTLEEMVTTSQKLIQALGNARNSSNSHSSRYFVNYRFTVNILNKRTLGVSVQSVFLETSRLWSLTHKQGSFLIFSLLSQPSLVSQVPILAKYKDLFAHEDLGDQEEDYGQLFAKLAHMGFTAEELETLVRVVAAVALLTTSSVQGAQLAEVLACPSLASQDLSSEKNRLLMAQDLYVKLFNWVIGRSNELTHGRTIDPSCMQVLSLIDCGGLEATKEGSYFESLTTNYAAECIEQFFIRHTFKHIQNDFKAEHLYDLVKTISYTDNTTLIEYYEQQLFPAIKDEDAQTSDAFQALPKCPEHFEEAAKGTFIIKHSRGSVQYKVEHFGVKNQCKVIDGFVERAQTTTLSSLKSLLSGVSCGEKHTGTLKQQIDAFYKQTERADHIFVKCVQVAPSGTAFDDAFVFQQLLEQNIVNSVKFSKTGYTQRMSYHEYYRRYHLLDPLNEKIPLSRHLTMGTDMKSLVAEMNKRIFPKQDKKMYIMGATNLYMQSDTGYRLEDLLNQWNRKLDKQAQTLQSAFKTHQFKKKLLGNVAKLAKLARDHPQMKGHALEYVEVGFESQLLANPNEFIKPVKQIKQSTAVQEVVLPKQAVVEDPISDKEAYSLLTLNQKEEYKKLKKARSDLHHNNLQQGLPSDGLFDESVAFSILTPEQKEAYHKKRAAMGYVSKQQDLAQRTYDQSDPESYVLLDEMQVKQYQQAKHERETTKKQAILSGNMTYQEPDETVSFGLLTVAQKEARQKHHLAKEQARLKAENAALLLEEGFISDPDSFALLSEQQVAEYILKKQEQQLIQQSQEQEGGIAQEQQDSIAFAMLTKEQQKKAKLLRRERSNKVEEQKKLQAMDAYLSDTEAYAQLTKQQRQVYKAKKLEQALAGGQATQGDSSVPVSYALLSEEQKEERRRLKVQNSVAAKLKMQKQYAVEEHVSDEESFVQLSDLQRTQYKKQKEEKKEIKREINALKYGFEGAISDPESLKLLTPDQKKEWQNKKGKKEQTRKELQVFAKMGVKSISDSETLALLNTYQRQQYVQIKMECPQQQSVAESLFDEEQVAQRQAQLRAKEDLLKQMDETGITPLMQETNIDLTDSFAYALLTLEQKIERRRIQQELEKARRAKLQNGQFAASEDVADSVAFAQLTVLQREDRKKKEVTKEKLKCILNPVLFAEDLDQEQSIAFALLTDLQRNQLYAQNTPDEPLNNDPSNSLAFTMLADKQKQERNKKVAAQQQSLLKLGGGDSDLSEGELCLVKNLVDKKQLQRDKIEAAESNKFNYAPREGFSDYEAFLVLDGPQREEYKALKAEALATTKDIAHNLLDSEQKKKLRRRKLKKQQRRVRKARRNYGVEGEISDYESFALLTEPQKLEYLRQKQGKHQNQLALNGKKYGVECELSDEEALCMLTPEQKQEWKLQKEKKLSLQRELAKAGFAVDYGDDAQEVVVLTLRDFDEREKKICKVERSIEDEEKKLFEELKRQEEEKLAAQKQHGQQENKPNVKRPTMLKKMGAEQMALRSDDFKTRGLDCWPVEATVYMKPIAQSDSLKDTVQKLIEHPELQPYVIPKTQKDKRLLESGAAGDAADTNPQMDEYDANFLKKVKENDYHKYCDKVVVRNKQFGKKDEIAKMMKHTSDNLQEPLTAVDELKAEKAKQMFRSLLKVGNVKKSRFTPKQHQEKILTGVIGSSALLELPPPPVKLLRSVTGKFDKIQKKQEAINKDKLLEGGSDGEEGSSPSKSKTGKTKAEIDKLNKDEKAKWNESDPTKTIDERVRSCTESPMSKLREEAYLQLFKQLGRNKEKNQIVPLLKFGIVLSSICAPTKDGILPLLNCLLDMIENDKYYKDPEVSKPARKLFMNLAQMAQSLMLQDKTKELTKLFPQSVEPESLVATFDPKKGDSQLKEKDKAILAPLRILKSEKEPLLPIFFKIAQGLNSVSDVQFYQLQNVLPRKYLPSEEEQLTMECMTQVVIKLLLFSETPIWVVTQHNALVHQVRDAAAKHIGKENLAQFFGLFFVTRENNQIISERYLDDDEKCLDVITAAEFAEKVQQETYKQNKTFTIYVRVRIYYRLFKNDLDSIDLFYFQQVYEMRRGRYPVKPSDATLLAAIELYQQYGKYKAFNSETTREAVEKKIDTLIPSKLLNGQFQEVRMRFHNEYLQTYTHKEWSHNTQEQYQDLSFDNVIQARWEYLSILRYYDMFLTQQFQASFFMVSKDSNGVMRKTQAQDCMFAIRPLHVVITDFPAKKTIRTIHFFDISSWGESEKGQNYFFVRNEDGSVSIFEFNERAQADYTLNAYVNWSIGKPIDSHLCPEFNDVLSYLIEKNSE